MKILILDDDYDKALWSKEALLFCDSSLEIDIEQYALEGLSMLKQNHYDLLVLDIQFSWSQGDFDKECGIEVAQRLEYNDIPIVICSSGSFPKELNDNKNIITFIRYGCSNVEEYYCSIIKKINKQKGEENN